MSFPAANILLDVTFNADTESQYQADVTLFQNSVTNMVSEYDSKLRICLYGGEKFDDNYLKFVLFTKSSTFLSKLAHAVGRCGKKGLIVLYNRFKTLP